MSLGRKFAKTKTAIHLFEVFRVWQREHPGTKLVPTNLSPAVAFMVERVADLAPDR